MKFEIIVTDPPWAFSDSLKMSDVKRGAESNYSVLTDQDIVNLDVKSIAADNSVLALWVPSSKIQIGLDCMNSYGFVQKQIWVWAKTKQTKSVRECIMNFVRYPTLYIDLTDLLSFGMGRLWRASHEIALIGTRGKVYNNLMNKSQRSVYFAPIGKHSEKPEGLQDQLELMFPNATKTELFARRSRKNWICVGNENKTTENEDIKVSLNKLALLTDTQSNEIIKLINENKLEEAKKAWNKLNNKQDVNGEKNEIKELFC